MAISNNTTGKRLRIAIYRRVSTPHQAEEGVSMDLQLEKCLEEADRIFGPGLYDYDDFADYGYSGSLGLRSQDPRKTKHRPALSDMVEAIQQGKYDAVFVYRLDRLFRSVPLAAHLLKLFQEHNVGLVSVQDKIDASTPHGRAIIYVMATMAQYFLEWMRENISASLRKLRSEGRFVAGIPPYGWRRPTQEEKAAGVTSDIVRDEHQGRWLLQIKEWYLAGWGWRRIIQALHDAGVPSPRGRQWWTYATLRKTLLNPIHAGLIHVGDGRLVRGSHFDLRYWDETEFRRLQQEADRRRRTPPSVQAAPHYLLADILFCGHCGRPMAGRRRQRGDALLYYRCVSPPHMRTPVCQRISKPTQVLETAVLELIRQFARQENVQRIALNEALRLLDKSCQQTQQEIDRLRRQLQEVDREIERWADLYSSSKVPLEVLEQHTQRLHERKRNIQQAISSAQQQMRLRDARARQIEQVSAALAHFSTAWDNLNPHERQQLIRLVVDQATLTRRDDGQMVMRLRLFTGEEREVILPRHHNVGPGQLTLRQLALVELTHQGLTTAQIARRWQVGEASVKRTASTIKKKLGVATLRQAHPLVADQIEKFRPWLPLDGRLLRKARPQGRTLLSDIERQVLSLRARRLHAAAIANHLGISRSTVYVHLHNIRAALGVATDTQAAHLAASLGIIDLDHQITPRLADRELAYLYLRFEQQLSDDQIAHKWQTNPESMRSRRHQILNKLNVGSLEEAYELVKDQIAQRRHKLPLGPLPSRQRKPALTEQNLRVLSLRAQNLPYSEIAHRLGISLPTVSHHLRHARKALGASSVENAISIAKSKGLI